MAFGTATLVADNKVAMQPLYVDTLTIALDTYATGGMTGLETSFEAALKASYGGVHNRTIIAVVPLKSSGYKLEWDSSNGKVLAYRMPALDGNAASAQALEEVANSFNLTGVTATFLIISK